MGDLSEWFRPLRSGIVAASVFGVVVVLIVGLNGLAHDTASSLAVVAVWGVGSILISTATTMIHLTVANVVEQKRQTEWERARADRKGYSE